MAVMNGADNNGADNTVVHARRAIVGNVERPATIVVTEGRFIAVGDYDETVGSGEVRRFAEDVVVMPGLVDSHVHVCEPGNTGWEGFATATAAALAGGITTIVDMPIDSFPATVDRATLTLKRRAAEGQCTVDVAFWGGVTRHNLERLGELHDEGVVGFKCFLVDSGAADFPPLSLEQLESALATAVRLGAPTMVHAEDHSDVVSTPRVRSYRDHLESLPPDTEDRAVAATLRCAARTGARVHIAHVSSPSAASLVAAARTAAVAATAETCPHYLALAAEEIADGQTSAKCSPPVREAASRELMWEMLRCGAVDCVVSDHSPSAPEMKTDDFSSAWGGISSLELSLPVVWSAARDRGFRLADLARWMADAPSRLTGLTTKGRIAVGADADLCVFAPDASFVVDPSNLAQRHPVTPYAGHRLHGVVKAVMLGGRWTAPGDKPGGRLLRRPESAGRRT